MTAGDLMTREVITVQASAPVRECMAAMVRGRVSGLPVLEAGRLAGIVTEGDLVRRLRRQVPWFALFFDGGAAPLPPVEPEGLHELLDRLRALPVRDVMSQGVVCTGPDADVEEVARVLAQRNVKRLPVVAGGRLVGIISRGDLVRGMLRG